ncbi:hypothetical protein BS78_02G310000 [Paspalum vaginatum]|nr:hypothetical protein BS78_02G310000 [Paspalum vaginatum]
MGPVTVQPTGSFLHAEGVGFVPGNGKPPAGAGVGALFFTWADSSSSSFVFTSQMLEESSEGIPM